MPKNPPGTIALHRGDHVPVARRGDSVIPGLTSNERTRIIKFIRDYKTHDLNLDDARTSIAYTYTLIERTEEEMERQDGLVERRLQRILNKEIVPEAVYEDGKLVKPQYTEEMQAEDIDTLKMAHSNKRITLFSRLAKLAKTLVEQMEKHEKMNVDKQKQSVISLEVHSSILAGLVETFTQALLREGLTEGQRVSIFRRFKKISQEYPVVITDLKQIRKRLFGDSDKPLIDADFKVLPDDKPVSSLDEAGSLISKKRKKL